MIDPNGFPHCSYCPVDTGHYDQETGNHVECEITALRLKVDALEAALKTQRDALVAIEASISDTRRSAEDAVAYLTNQFGPLSKERFDECVDMLMGMVARNPPPVTIESSHHASIFTKTRIGARAAPVN